MSWVPSGSHKRRSPEPQTGMCERDQNPQNTLIMKRCSHLNVGVWVHRWVSIKRILSVYSTDAI